MKNGIAILFLTLLSLHGFSYTDPEEGDKKEKTKASGDVSNVVHYEAPQIRTFDGLDLPAPPQETPDPIYPEEFAAPLNDTLSYYHKRALMLDERIKSLNKFVDVLDEKTLTDMPIGLKKEIGGLIYSISLDSIVMTPRGAYLIAYMVFEEPSTGKKLTFRGNNIQLSKEGGLTGQARLELIGDRPINLFGNKSRMILKGNGSTYVEFDCNGFKRMGIGGEIEFSRDLIVPETIYGNVKEGRVKASFTASVGNWNDLMAEVEIPSFQIKGLEGFGFRIKNAVFDYSDYRNAPAVEFPRGYIKQTVPEGSRELWRGFFMRELLVSLPKQFNSKGSRKRKKFNASDVIIDHLGFTGDLKALNLIGITDGDMNGWAYSLEEIDIEMQANQLKEGTLKGEIVVPVSNVERAFEYTAIINSDNEYIFNVEASDSVQFDMFKTSKVEIYPSSYIEVKVEEDKFLPKANFHGTMNISAKLGKKGVDLADIAFENLEIQSVKPYIQVETFSFGSEAAQQAMANFPISINEIGIENISDTEVGLDFDLLLNLTGSDGGAFAADAGLTIVSEMPEDAETQQWVYKDVEVKDIDIDIDGGAFKFEGSLTFYKNDPVYGEGFNGQVDAEFKPGIKVKATAIFGNVDGYRYWYADALASFSGGIPIFTGVGVYGFGGGAYYRMAMDTENVGSELGETASGIVYVPRENAGLGLKATLEIGSHPKPEAFNGDVTLEASFFKGGGIRYISFKGNGYLATPPAAGTLANIKNKTQKLGKAVAVFTKSAGNAEVLLASSAENDATTAQIYGQIGEAAGKKGQISAHVFISYDFENRVLHGNFEAYMNVAGGVIKGIGPGGRAGWAVLHFAPDEWYVYVGTPDNRIGLSVGIGPIRAQATSYFMVGTSIPGSPPPPPEVSEILGGADLDYMRDLNALGKGAGFAFGSSFGIDTGDLTFLMFYARFAAGAGFDIMLKDYSSAQCAGRSGPIGVNGWYANGQAYAFFDGKIGIRVKVFGRRKKVDILNIAAAAVLQAKLPNPFWMRGIVGGRFSVLGGLVSGNCKFEVTIGEECELVGGSVLEGIQVIAEVTPNNGADDVNVFNIPQAVFNMPVNKVFEMIDLDDRKKSFRIKLDEFKLISGGYEIPGTIEFNDHNDVVAFNSFDIFPSQKKIKAMVQVSFEEKVSGSWRPVIVDGKKYTESSEVTFTSGVAPDHIPLENVAYSYPVVNQLNFYKDEYDKGYIKLKRGQPELFEVGEEWVQKGRFVSTTGSTSFFNFSYTKGTKEVNFDLPDNLQNNQIYAFELVNLPAQAAGAIDRNVSDITNNLDTGNETLEMEVTTKEAEGIIDELQEKVVFGANFRSSRFNTLKSKIASGVLLKGYSWQILPGIDELKAKFEVSESFGKYEIHSGPANLVVFEASLDNRWYTNLVKPLVYDDYPIEGKLKFTTERELADIGVPPARAVYLLSGNYSLNIENPDHNNNINQRKTILYNLPYAMNKDYMYLLNHVADVSVNTSSQRMEYLLLKPFPVLKFDSYKVNVQYFLPGIRKKRSEEMITIDYNY